MDIKKHRFNQKDVMFVKGAARWNTELSANVE